MDNIKIGDSVWHPCNMDIIEHKITGINTFTVQQKGKEVTQVQYTTQAKHNVGACGRVEVVLSKNNGVLRFIELLNEDRIEYASGLQDFVEGIYYVNKYKAKLEFYKEQEVLSWSSMENQKRLYEKCKSNHERVKKIVTEIKEDLNNG